VARVEVEGKACLAMPYGIETVAYSFMTSVSTLRFGELYLISIIWPWEGKGRGKRGDSCE
jgi:hypothetical protein